jgi:hypothetical protein
MTVSLNNRRPLVKEIGCTSSCPTPPIQTERKRKQVTFAPYVRVKPILHIDDYSDEEFFSTWYGPEDMKQITQDIRQTLAKMEESGELIQDDEHFCRRGLESRTTKGARMKQHIRLAAKNAVLDKQAVHGWQGKYNEQLISDVYIDVALASKLAAVRRGFDDLEEEIDQELSRFISKKAVVDCSSIILRIESPPPAAQVCKMSYRLLNEGLWQL